VRGVESQKLEVKSKAKDHHRGHREHRERKERRKEGRKEKRRHEDTKKEEGRATWRRQYWIEEGRHDFTG
jgi:hypothetical protein